MYHFPAIHPPKIFHSISNGETWMPIFFQTYSSGGATIGSPICSGILTTARFLVLRLTLDY